MKTHFETPGAPQVESLNNLAAGMNTKAAALLFYQTCGIFFLVSSEAVTL
jgi:cohesin complex subunit SCC1